MEIKQSVMVGCNGEHNSFWNGRKITVLREPVHIEVNCEFLLLFIKNRFNKKWLWYLYTKQIRTIVIYETNISPIFNLRK